MASFYYDYRLGGVPQAVYGEPSELMRIPETILDCVAFLVTKESGTEVEEKRCRGTAFFISVPSKVSKGITYPYLVTAKHCVAKIKKEKSELYLRLNRHDDRSEDIRISAPWFMSDDPSVDLAVMPCAPNSAKYKYRTLDHTMLGNAAKIEELNIGIGDEIVVSGLFTRRSGREKSIPIVRFGNISAMPSEPIPDSETGLDFHAYLAEVRSIGGLSGSPVFAYIGPGRVDPRGNTLRFDYSFLILIGVIRGHWRHKEPIPFQSVWSDEVDKINWGVGVVTPITYLEPILYSEVFVKQREELDKKYLEQDSPTNDMADDKDRGQPFTQADFEDALKKASRKIDK
jgi:hypothetical protein